MRDCKECSELMERIIHKYNQSESRKQNYGAGEELTRKEIHTISAIGENPTINITELANLRGVTKGAVSQMVYKLVDKGYLIKRISPDSDAEVRLELTDKGRKAYDGHNEFHRKTQQDFFVKLNNMPEGTYKEMLEILKSFEDMLDQGLSDK